MVLNTDIPGSGPNISFSRRPIKNAGRTPEKYIVLGLYKKKQLSRCRNGGKIGNRRIDGRTEDRFQLKTFLKNSLKRSN
jgi:hypothetical protein